MPIYQRPTDNIGVTKTFSGTITDSGSTPIEGAVVALKRKGGGIVAFADTDASGNYSFNIDADGDFQIEYSLSKDSNVRTITDELSPANPYNSYTPQCCLRLSADSLYYPNSYIAWKSMPSATVVDSLGYQTGVFGNIAHSIVFGGSGSGASASLGAVVAGDYRARSSAPYYYIWTSDELNFGTYINKVTWTSFGEGYTAPLLKVSGTSVNYRIKSGDPLENEYEITVNGQEYYAQDQSATIYYGIQTIDIKGQYEYNLTYFSNEANTKTKDYIEEQFNGSSYNLGEWTSLSPPQGQRLTADLPGEQDKSNFDSSSTISAADAELQSIIRDDEVYSVNNHQFQIYGQVIYLGVTGVDGNGVFTGYREGSAKEAEATKKITLKELDILKGYFGRYGLIEGILPVGQTTTAAIANFFNFGYQMIQGITAGVSGQYNADSPNNWMYEMDAGNKSTLFTAVAKEFRSFLRQKDGVDVPESQFGKVIYPILQKAGITYRYVGAGSQRQKWTFTSNGIVKVSDPE